jgi:hypothetical protein
VRALIHHLVHVGFVGAAVVVFVAFVAVEVRRRGWPKRFGPRG